MPVLSETEKTGTDLSSHSFLPTLTLDVRSRMFICLLASASVIFFKGQVALGFFTAVTFFYVLFSVRRRQLLGVCYLGMLAMWLVSICFVLLFYLFVKDSPLADFSAVLIPFLRSLVMLNAVLALALTSRVQILLSALKGLRLPVWFYIPTVVVIRFIPDFIRDVKQISETIRIRGYKLNALFLLCHPLLSVRLLFVPMLFRALRSADELAIAAELKGIRPDVKMVSYRPTAFGKNDIIALAVVILIVAIGVGLELQFPSSSKGGMM